MTTQREPLRRIRKAFFFVLKLAIATAIVWVIVARNFQAIKEGFATFRYLWLIPAAARWISVTTMSQVSSSMTPTSPAGRWPKRRAGAR